MLGQNLSTGLGPNRPTRHPARGATYRLWEGSLARKGPMERLRGKQFRTRFRDLLVRRATRGQQSRLAIYNSVLMGFVEHCLPG